MDDYQRNDQNGYQNGYGNGWGSQGQGYYQQNYYQNAYYQDPRRSRLEEPMTLGEWLLTILVAVIPCVNVIMMFVWAFGRGTKRSKSNWAKAILIFMLIGVVIGVILSVTQVIPVTEYYMYLYGNGWY